MADSVYWIWFQLVFGVGGRRSELALNYFENPVEIYEDVRAGGKICGMLEQRELEMAKTAMVKAEEIKSRTLKKGCSIVTPDHEDYPPLLREIYGRPAALYLKGDISCLRDSLCIAVIGSRDASDYGTRATKMISKGLAASGAVIVSGLANGIDSTAHQAALDAGGKTVGFLGCGIDVDYPKGSGPLKKAISENGAVVSEFPLGEEPRPYHFPIRNRVVSGVSHGVLVAEAGKKSGALITAGHALDQGRDVFAVPGSVLSSRHKGAHMLIKDGARLVDSAADILIAYPDLIRREKIARVSADDGESVEMENDLTNKAGLKPASSLPPKKEERLKHREIPEGLSPEAAELYPRIGGTPANVDEICTGMELDTGAILSALTELEIYGMIKMYPGRLFGLAPG